VNDRKYRSVPNLEEEEAEGMGWNVNCSFRGEATLNKRSSRSESLHQTEQIHIYNTFHAS